MTPDQRGKLRQLLLKHEGYKLRLYTDSVGKQSIGIGRNLTDRGVLPTEIDLMFHHDTDFFFNFLSVHFEWFPKLNEARQIALTDMAFMGTQHFLSFTKMIAALADGNYVQAANEIINSEYRKQVGQRALDIANIILHGEL